MGYYDNKFINVGLGEWDGGIMKNKTKSNSERIAMLSIYMEEWKYRDQTMLATLYKTSFISFVIIMLPYLKTYFGISQELPFKDWMFSLCGIILALIFVPVNLGNLARQKKSSETIRKIIDLLPEELQREGIDGFSLAHMRVAQYLVFVLQLAVFVLGIVVIHVRV